MPVALTYPGVYVEELTSDVHTITGVATSITAFMGRTLRGPTDRAVLLQSYADFIRVYGGLSLDSTVSYAVQQFFLNGGSQAVIVRLHNGAQLAKNNLLGPVKLQAANEGTWGGQLCVRVDYATKDPTNTKLFNLFVKDMGSGVTESFRNLSVDSTDSRFVTTVLKQESQLIRVDPTSPLTGRPPANAPVLPGKDPFSDPAYYTAFNSGGDDGSPIIDNIVQTNLGLLDKVDIFNLLCIPPLTRDTDVGVDTWNNAISYARGRRAVVLVDAPTTWNTIGNAVSGVDDASFPTRQDNAAVYFPRLLIPDPLIENRLQAFAPCGVMAGVIARTDTDRGVWKAPAGIDATLINVSALTLNGDDPATITDPDNGQVNPLGVNCLRNFPVIGRVAWGARTLRGADALADQWKYLPVRRLAYYIEESLYRGTQWVVFEPNDEPLWAQIRLNVGDFMQTLFRQGAFQGQTPSEAYFVKCNSETTTPTDISNGVVNILVGFAPLEPAEFVVIQIQQITATQS